MASSRRSTRSSSWRIPSRSSSNAALLAMPKLLRHQPIHVGWPPRLLSWIDASQPQHQRRGLLALALQVLLRRLTGAREIAHSLVPLVGHPDRSELAHAQQLGEAQRIAAVRLHPLAG